MSTLLQFKQTEINHFLELRNKLFKQISIELEVDGHCKSYEGAFEISVLFENYFEANENKVGPIITYSIKLHCYIIGPSRHYEWTGVSFADALKKAEEDIIQWIK